MPTTTITTIRDKQVSLIRALTPTSLAGRPFTLYDENTEFRDWAEANPKSALRSFHIADLHEDDAPLSSDLESEEVEAAIEVLVAYPKDGRYGRKNKLSAMDLIREDKHKIDGAIGLRGFQDYVSGQSASIVEQMSVEEGEAVWILVMTYRLNFRRAV